MIILDMKNSKVTEDGIENKLTEKECYIVSRLSNNDWNTIEEIDKKILDMEYPAKYDEYSSTRVSLLKLKRKCNWFKYEYKRGVGYKLDAEVFVA